MLSFSESWRSRLQEYQTLYVAFSGGIDSSVLLHLLCVDEALKPKVKAIHIHHGLSPNADAWASHCQAVCDTLNIPLKLSHAKLEAKANIEETARKARYALMQPDIGPKDALLTAHHQDDQAETVLLNLMRGSGVQGLAAMPKIRSFGEGYLLRPLLDVSRADIEAYAKHHAMTYIEDESNTSTAYSRNFLRHSIMPLLQERWPGAASNMARAAEHCADAMLQLEEKVHIDTPEVNSFMLPLGKLNAHVFRAWLKTHDVPMPSTQHLQKLISMFLDARQDKQPSANLGSFQLRRYQGHLYLIPAHTADNLAPSELNIPKGAKVTVKTRVGGEVITWRGHTRRLKTLLHAWGVPPWVRDTMPLLYINDMLAVVPGYAVADEFHMDRKEEVHENT